MIFSRSALAVPTGTIADEVKNRLFQAMSPIISGTITEIDEALGRAVELLKPLLAGPAPETPADLVRVTAAVMRAAHRCCGTAADVEAAQAQAVLSHLASLGAVSAAC